MINRLIIRNQNIVDFPQKIKIRFDDRELTVELPKNSLLKIRPHLFCVVINNCATFYEEEMPINESNYKITEEEYKKALLTFLKSYIETKKQKINTKMDLVRLYFAINDVEGAFDVLGQMKCTGNVKMIRFILKNIKSRTINTSQSSDRLRTVNDSLIYEQTTAYKEFIDICKEIDYHSAYVLAFEVLSSFDTQSLFHLYEDLKDIYLEKTLPQSQSSELNTKYSTKEHTTYDLSVFLMVKIAMEFTARNQFKMAGSMLINAAKMVYNTVDRCLVEEMLSLAFVLLDIDQKLFEEALESNDEMMFNLTPVQRFYISSRFKMKNQSLIADSNFRIDPCHDFLNSIIRRAACQEAYKISIASYTNIFNFDVIKKSMQGVFTDKVKISIKDSKNAGMPVMGVVDMAGTFYQCKENTFYSNVDIEGKCIVLGDGRQVVHEFKMRKIEKNTDLILLDIQTLKGTDIKPFNLSEDVTSMINEQDGCKMIKFKLKNGKKCNFSFKDSIHQELKDSFLYVFVPIECKQVESTIEINEGIYETRLYFM